MHHHSRVWALLDGDARAQFWATLALRHTQGLGARSWTRLLQAFGSAHAAIDHLPQWSRAGVSSDKAAQTATGSWRVTAREEWNAAQDQDAHIIMWHDPLYPALLRELPDAPALLYCKGDLSLLSAPSVAVVGSRGCTGEGVRVAGAVARRLSDCGIAVVSGMAQGIDRVAHTAALRGVGKSIGVLGTGIDIMYPQKNVDIYHDMLHHGLLATEFAPGVVPAPGNFPIRNRIISGLALGVLVVEAALRSGSLITARLALEQNREVYAVPGPAAVPASLGCQELIRQGARPVFNAEDIIRDMATLLEQFGIEQKTALGTLSEAVYTEKQNTQKRSTEEHIAGDYSNNCEELADVAGDHAKILYILHQKECCHVDTVCELSGLPAFRISGLLTELEVSGHVRRLSGARYVLSPQLRAKGFTVAQ